MTGERNPKWSYFGIGASLTLTLTAIVVITRPFSRSRAPRLTAPTFRPAEPEVIDLHLPDRERHQGPVPEPLSMDGRGRETLTYLIGYGLALALTFAAYAAVFRPIAAFSGTFAIILALALVQMIVQFRCFLHISLRRSARADLLLVLFAALIVTLMVSGTLVIILNLRERMM